MSSSVTACPLVSSCKSYPGSDEDHCLPPSPAQEADWHQAPSPSQFLLDKSLEAAPCLIPHLAVTQSL